MDTIFKNSIVIRARDHLIKTRCTKHRILFHLGSHLLTSMQARFRHAHSLSCRTILFNSIYVPQNMSTQSAHGNASRAEHSVHRHHSQKENVSNILLLNGVQTIMSVALGALATLAATLTALVRPLKGLATVGATVILADIAKAILRFGWI